MNHWWQNMNGAADSSYLIKVWLCNIRRPKPQNQNKPDIRCSGSVFSYQIMHNYIQCDAKLSICTHAKTLRTVFNPLLLLLQYMSVGKCPFCLFIENLQVLLPKSAFPLKKQHQRECVTLRTRLVQVLHAWGNYISMTPQRNIQRENTDL